MSDSAATTALIREFKTAKIPAKKRRLLDRLVRQHAKLIRRLVQKAAFAEKSAEDHDDLFQAGCIGFVTALERFDPDRGLSISTYAAHWIRHEVQQTTRSGRAVRLPRIRLTNDERKAVIERLKVEPEVTAEELGIAPFKLEQIKNSIGVRFVSTETPRGATMLESSGTAEHAGARVEQGEAFRRLWSAVAAMNRHEVSAVRTALDIKRARASAASARADQLGWSWQGASVTEPRESATLSAALLLASLAP